MTSDPLVDRLVDGRYQVVERIARGGMATVYRAVDKRLDRDVALKVMHPHLGDGAMGAEFISRFRREARSAARLTHPGLVAVYDQGVDGEICYLTMEYVPGANLRRLLATKGPFTLDRTLTILEQILDALSAAHRAGLVHRDIKPENVLVDTDGRVKLTDFGLARAMNEATAATATGTVLGTVAYLSPELIATGQCDSRTDVYAIGILAYEMLTSTAPHHGDTPIQVAFQHVNTDVPRPSALLPWLPAEVDDLVCALTARDVADRPADAKAALAMVKQVHAALSPQDLAHLVAAPTVPVREDTTILRRSGAQPTSPRDMPTQALGHRTVEPTARLAALSPQELNAAGITPPPPPPPTPFTYPHAAAGPNQTVALDTGRPRRRRGSGLLVALLLFLVGGTAGCAWWWFTNGPGSYISVPAGLVGVEQATAQDLLTAAKLTYTTSKDFDDVIPAGNVISTRPEPGTRVRKDAKVELVISQGIEMLTVPPGLVGATKDAATTALTDAGFTVGEPGVTNDDTVPQGQVLTVTSGGEPVVEGSELRHDTIITLTISDGPAPVTVPQVSGLEQAEATEALEKLGLKVTATEEISETVAKGRVIRQDPAGAAEAHRMDTVNLVVSSGPPMVELPNVTGQNIRTAQATLEALGFKVKVETPQGFSPLNMVYSQNPQGGNGRTAPKGSTITLDVF